MRKLRQKRLLLVRLLLAAILMLLASAASAFIWWPTQWGSGGSFAPTGLPQHFALGVQQQQGDTWANTSGVTWDYSYAYFNQDWYTQAGGGGNMATNWVTENTSNSRIPAFTAYFGTGSANATSVSIPVWFNTASVMGGAQGTNTGYWDQVALLLQRISAATAGYAVVDIEPDLFGF